MNPLRRCNEIDQAQLDRVRRNSYVRDLYLHTLVKSTLIGFDLVSVEEVKSLEAVAVAGAASGSLLPELENHEAKQAVMRFFDTLNMSNDRELMEAVDGIQPHTLVPSVFEGIISNADSLRSLLLADRAGQESYRVFLAYKMGRTVDDPSVDNEMAKYLAFVYVYENGAKLDTLIAEMIDAEGDPNQPGRGYSWDEIPRPARWPRSLFQETCPAGSPGGSIGGQRSGVSPRALFTSFPCKTGTPERL